MMGCDMGLRERPRRLSSCGAEDAFLKQHTGGTAGGRRAPRCQLRPRPVSTQRDHA
jgi:hypothetical protein